MTLPASAPITLSAIQTEFSSANLLAAATAAGVSANMLAFLGKSAFSPFLAAYTTVGTTNLTVPAGCTQIEMIIAGGGGAGGGTDTGSGAGNRLHAGGGGGGGGVVNQTISVTAGQSITVVVGAGGSAGAGNPNNWTHGSASSVTYGGSTYTGGGGLRGYFAVKGGGTGYGGNSGSPQSQAGGGPGLGNVGSGGGGSTREAGGNPYPNDTIPPQYYGGDGGMPEPFSVTGYQVFLGGGGAGGGGTYPGVSQTTTFAGGGDGAMGVTPSDYSGLQAGDNGSQGGVVFYYK